MRLKELRKKIGLSQEQIAGILKITQQAYANYEVGKREPDIKTLLSLSDIFGVTTDYLLGHSDDPTPPKSEKKELLSLRETQLIYNKLVEIGAIEDGSKVTKDQAEALLQLFENQADYICFILNNKK